MADPSSSASRTSRLDEKLKAMLEMLDTTELGSGAKTKQRHHEEQTQPKEGTQDISRSCTYYLISS